MSCALVAGCASPRVGTPSDRCPGVAIVSNEGIVAVEGDLIVIAAPAEVGKDEPECDDAAMIFQEAEAAVLSGVEVEATAPGNYQRRTDLYPTMLPDGPVDVYLLHVNQEGERRKRFSASVTFKNPILGLIATQGNLPLTNRKAGAKDTVYENVGHWNLAGTEDSFVLSPDMRRLQFYSVVASGADDLRIFVSTTPAPGETTP